MASYRTAEKLWGRKFSSLCLIEVYKTIFQGINFWGQSKILKKIDCPWKFPVLQYQAIMNIFVNLLCAGYAF